MMDGILWAAGWAAMVGCAARTAPAASEVPSPPAVSSPAMSVDRVSGGDVRGISGLARDERGYWMVPERARLLFRFQLGPDGAQLAPGLPIQGVPDGLDLESIAVMPDGRIAAGTESLEDGRAADQIYFLRVDDERAVVEGPALPMPYAAWALTPDPNRGIEGLAFVEGMLLAASETVGQHEGSRFAPLGAYDVAEKRWSFHRVWLTTEKGKLSALAARSAPGRLELFAIERHYGVSRILRFGLPRFGPGRDVKPEVVVDLATLFSDPIPNFEGLELAENGDFVLVSDNDYGGQTGVTLVVRIQPPQPPTPGFVQ